MRRRPVFVVGAPRDDLERMIQRSLIGADRIEIAPAAIIGAIIARRMVSHWALKSPAKLCVRWLRQGSMMRPTQKNLSIGIKGHRPVSRVQQLSSRRA
jgi:hypothetical protein